MSRFLVDPGDSVAPRERILSLLDWRISEAGLGASCADWVDAKYPYERHITAIEDVLSAYRRVR